MPSPQMSLSSPPELLDELIAEEELSAEDELALVELSPPAPPLPLDEFMPPWPPELFDELSSVVESTRGIS